MRLLSDPQPAIEWFYTGGSVCIGVEGPDERPDVDVQRDMRMRVVSRVTTPPVACPVRVGEA
jgi:hypothetical protein